MQHFPELDIEILQTIEAHNDPARFVDFSNIQTHPVDQVRYQVGLLGKRGLIEVHDTRTDDDPFGWSADCLTAAGHEYLRKQRSSQSFDTAPEAEDPPIRDGGGPPDTNQPTLQRWKQNAENHPVTAAIVLVFAVVVGFAGGWKQITGVHLWTSISDVLTGNEQTHQECIASSEGKFVEILACHRTHGLLPQS